jgi:4-amino-4-deoxy-L-arabinose transferase-like glycosyltransferase
MKNSIRLFIGRYWILILFVIVKMALQYILVNPYYEPHRDEYLHLDEANHLALGYISVPPFTAMISKIIFLLGGGIFWIRFFPAFFGALTIVFAWLITEALGGRMISRITVSLAILFSVYARLNILFQPNSFDILVWTASFFFLIKYIKSRNEINIWWLALILAIGFYNKYTVIFLAAGIIAGLLLSSERKILSRPVLWKAVALALLLISPNLIWQIQHNFPVLDHMRVLKHNQLDNNSALGFIRSQLKIIAGSLPLLVSGIVAFFSFKPFKKYRVVGFCFFVVMILFTLASAKDYYSLGLYPVVFAFGSVYLENILAGKVRPVVYSLVIAFNLILFGLIFRFIFPVLKPSEIVKEKALFEKIGLLRWEDGKNHMLPQDFSDMTGWREMADKALKAYENIPENQKESTLVFCDNYGETGALNYFNRGKMKEAYSFNTDYVYWLPRIPNIRNVLLVGEKPDENIAKLFKVVMKTDSVENIYSREKGTGIYLLMDADSSFTKIFYDEAERRKKELDIF